MKIQLSAYGFIRAESEDFEDDGNHFICYKLKKNPRLKVSKLVRDGEVYIAGHIYSVNMPSNILASLSHYHCLDDLNGESACNITKDILIQFQRDCEAFMEELEKAEVSYNHEKSMEKYRKEHQDEDIEINVEKLAKLLKGKYLAVYGWLGYHQTAFNDFKAYIEANKISVEKVSMLFVIEWICQHKQLTEDFLRYFNINIADIKEA